MNKKTLLTLVKKEAKKLQQHATKDELSLLDFKLLDPKQPRTCLYGLMTGSCWKERASELILKCAGKVYQQKSMFCELTDATLEGKINKNFRRNDCFSPIECFICFPKNKVNGNNKILIDYLRGDTNKLIFKKF